MEQAFFEIAVLVARKVSPGFPIELFRPVNVGQFSQSLGVDGNWSAEGENFEYAVSIWMMDADRVAANWGALYFGQQQHTPV